MRDNVASVTTTRSRAADQRGVVHRPHRQRARRGPWARALTTATAASVLLFAAGCAFNPDLNPQPLNPSASTRVLAADGSQLALLDAGIHRQPITLSQMGATLPNAVVAIEDHGFFDHDGVDLKSIARALRDDINAGKVVEGGSTITQQYVRNVLLTGDKTVHRKLKEMVLAVEVEQQLSKKQILERYLNAVYFGDGAYGAEEAAEHYFGHPASQLTLVQSATLAGLLQAPDHDDPFHDPTAARTRRNEVLAAMAKYHYVSRGAGRHGRGRARATRARRRTPTTRSRPTSWSRCASGSCRTRRSVRPKPTARTRSTRTATRSPPRSIRALRPPPRPRCHRSSSTGPPIPLRPSCRSNRTPAMWSRTWAVAGTTAPRRGRTGTSPARLPRPMGSTFKPFVLAAALEQHIPLTRVLQRARADDAASAG